MTTHQLSGFRVGDRVTVRYGGRSVAGEIIEDRGPFGADGRRLYRVSIPVEPDEPIVTLFAEDEIQDFVPPPSIPRAQVLDYFSQGGLLSILQHRAVDSDSRVWLCQDSVGGVTYTFQESRGEIGGERIPALAVRDERILRTKTKDVVVFLKSFGLTDAEAARVIQSVGTTG